MIINAYKKIEGVHFGNYKKAAQCNMKVVTRIVRKGKLKENFSENQVVVIDASFDGNWQKGGYSSLKSVVCVVHGKIRKGLQSMIVLLQTIMVKCAINFNGSAGAMESTGVVIVFWNLTNFIGDGDTKSHSDVVAADPYPGTPMKILECVKQLSWL